MRAHHHGIRAGRFGSKLLSSYVYREQLHRAMKRGMTINDLFQLSYKVAMSLIAYVEVGALMENLPWRVPKKYTAQARRAEQNSGRRVLHKVKTPWLRHPGAERKYYQWPVMPDRADEGRRPLVTNQPTRRRNAAGETIH